MLKLMYLSILTIKLNQGILIFFTMVSFLYMELFLTLHTSVYPLKTYDFIFFEWFHFVIFFITLKIITADFMKGSIKLLLTGNRTKLYIFSSKLLSITLISLVFYFYGQVFKILGLIRHSENIELLYLLGLVDLKILYCYCLTGVIIGSSLWVIGQSIKDLKHPWKLFICIYVPYYFVLGNQLNPSKDSETNIIYFILRHTPAYLIFDLQHASRIEAHDLLFLSFWILLFLIVLAINMKRKSGYLRSR